MIAQILIFLLMADAAFVAYGLIKKKNRWWFIYLYWILLTAKNLVDFMRW